MRRLDYRLLVHRDGAVVGELVDGAERSMSRRGELDVLQIARLRDDAMALLDAAEPPRRKALQDVGERLYRLDFPYPVSCHFEERAWRELNEHPGDYSHLALSLLLDEQLKPEVLALPWEFLYLAQGDIFLATDGRVAFSRGYDDWQNRQWQPLDAAEPLRVLLVRLQPEGLNRVALAPLRNHLAELARATGRIATPHVLENPKPLALAGALKTLRPHVVHLLAHGRFEDHGTAFALVDEATGQPRWYADQSIADLFRAFPPRLILVQACEGGRGSALRSFRNGAAWLVRGHAPAVIAMQYPITNQTGWTFANALYESIIAGDDLDQAVQSARQVLALDDDQAGEVHANRDFGAFTLWLQPAVRQFFSEPIEPRPEADATMGDANVRLIMETPDNALIEAAAPRDSLIDEVLTEVLDQWEQPRALASRSLRYVLRLGSADSPPLERTSRLADLVEGAELRLVLTPEPLEPSSPVGLIVQDAQGRGYRTQVLLSTRVERLAAEFLLETGDSDSVADVRCEQIGPGGIAPRTLEIHRTLYESGVGDGACIRIIGKTGAVPGGV